MLQIINSYVLGVTKLEKILNSVKYNKLYVFGGFNKREDNKIIITPDLECAEITSTTDYSNQIYKNEPIIDNFFTFREENDKLNRYYNLLGEETSDVKDFSFNLTKYTNNKDKLIKQWINNLNIITNMYQKRYVHTPCFISFSVSYIFNENQEIDILVIEGTSPMEQDMILRKEILQTLFLKENISTYDILSIYKKELFKYNIEFQESPRDINRDEYISFNTSFLKNQMLRYKNLYSKFFSHLEDEIIYMYISLFGFLLNNFDLEEDIYMKPIVSPNKLKLNK